jgi:hypothetical protein
MIPTLSIILPSSSTNYALRAFCIPLRISFYDAWTASDYAYVYQDANDTPFTWDDVHVPRRSPRLSNKDKKNYKL